MGGELDVADTTGLAIAGAVAATLIATIVATCIIATVKNTRRRPPQARPRRGLRVVPGGAGVQERDGRVWRYHPDDVRWGITEAAERFRVAERASTHALRELRAWMVVADEAGMARGDIAALAGIRRKTVEELLDGTAARDEATR